MTDVQRQPLGISMTSRWIVSAVLAVSAWSSIASAKEASLILLNGKVWTENPAQPVAQAVAVDGSTILAVGDNAAIRKFAGPDTKIIDLGGRLVVPGFNDSHVHFMMGGESLVTVQLGTANSQAELR